MKRAPSIPRAGREAVLDAHKLSNAEARIKAEHKTRYSRST
jgi:hypothetical protein